MSKRIDVAKIAPVIGTLYPTPFDQPCRSRERRRLGDAAGLQQFGVNLLHLPPGAWSSQRHWHTNSDEFVYVLSGDVTLVTDAGDEVLRPGDAAGFKAGDRDGHCLQRGPLSIAPLGVDQCVEHWNLRYAPNRSLVSPELPYLDRSEGYSLRSDPPLARHPGAPIPSIGTLPSRIRASSRFRL